MIMNNGAQCTFYSKNWFEKKGKIYITKVIILDRFRREITYVQAKIRDQSVHCVNDRYMAKI